MKLEKGLFPCTVNELSLLSWNCKRVENSGIETSVMRGLLYL
jgi:hypothetical protein